MDSVFFSSWTKYFSLLNNVHCSGARHGSLFDILFRIFGKKKVLQKTTVDSKWLSLKKVHFHLLISLITTGIFVYDNGNCDDSSFAWHRISDCDAITTTIETNKLYENIASSCCDDTMVTKNSYVVRFISWFHKVKPKIQTLSKAPI